MLSSVKSLWVRFWLRRSQFTGRYGNLQKLYTARDPWNLLSEKEQYRFAAINDLVRDLAPDCGQLLELGCGEGFQTRWLRQVSRSVTGLEVSARAVARARRDLPDVPFHVGKVEDAGRVLAGRRFNLVTACEVLYYSDDIAAAIRETQMLTDMLLVTNYAPRAVRMRENFAGAGWERLADIMFEDAVWECHVWRRGGPAESTPQAG